MTIATSVYDGALQLAAEARRLQAGQKDEQEAQQVANRVLRIQVELGELAEMVAIAASLTSAGAGNIDLSDIDGGRAAFAARAATGLPAESAFKTAQQRLKSITAGIADEVAAAWADWSAAEITALPLNRMPLLPADQQQAAKQRQNELVRFSRQVKPGRPTITQFQVTLRDLKDTLGEVPDPTPEVVALLAKIDGPPAASLGDLTDEEIAVLRREGLDGQITLRRMSA